MKTKMVHVKKIKNCMFRTTGSKSVEGAVNHFKLSIFTKHRNGLWCGYKKMLFRSDLSLSFLLGLKVAMQTTLNKSNLVILYLK